MRKNNLIFVIVSLAFLPIAYYGGTHIRDSIYGEKFQTPSSTRSASEVGDVVLTDHKGRPFQFSRFGAEYLLVFFGYTHCPDFCPTALSDITTAMNKMGPAAERIKIAFVTFDPQRDSRNQLATYLKNFYPGIIGLTGTEEEIAAAASRFGMQYRVNQETKSEDGAKYDFEHSLSYFLVDAKGTITEIFRYSEGPEKLEEGLRMALKKG